MAPPPPRAAGRSPAADPAATAIGSALVGYFSTLLGIEASVQWLVEARDDDAAPPVREATVLAEEGMDREGPTLLEPLIDLRSIAGRRRAGTGGARTTSDVADTIERLHESGARLMHVAHRLRELTRQAVRSRDVALSAIDRDAPAGLGAASGLAEIVRRSSAADHDARGLAAVAIARGRSGGVTLRPVVVEAPAGRTLVVAERIDYGRGISPEADAAADAAAATDRAWRDALQDPGACVRAPLVLDVVRVAGLAQAVVATQRAAAHLAVACQDLPGASGRSDGNQAEEARRWEGLPDLAQRLLDGYGRTVFLARRTGLDVTDAGPFDERDWVQLLGTDQ